MRCFCRLACTILVALMISLCSVCPAVSVGNEKELNKLETLGQKISKVTSNPKVRKYFSGALLGSAFAATVQPFKNAKDHFLVWDFKTSSRRGIFIAMKHIAHEHGILSLFKGVTLSTLIFAPLFAAFAGNYNVIKEQSLKIVKLLKKEGSPEAVAKREADAKARADATAKAKAEKEAHAAKLKAEQEKRAADAKKKVEEEQRKREEVKAAAEKLKQEQLDAAKKESEDAKKGAEAQAAKANEDAAAATSEKSNTADAEPAKELEKTPSSTTSLETQTEADVEETETVVEEGTEEVVDAATGETSTSNEEPPAQA